MVFEIAIVIEAVKLFFTKAAAGLVAFFNDPMKYINKFIAWAKAYFSSLTQYELFAWIGEGAGFVLVIVSLFLW